MPAVFVAGPTSAGTEAGRFKIEYRHHERTPCVIGELPLKVIHHLSLCFLMLFLVLPLAALPTVEEDLAAARTLFEANLDAIRQRDREAYLACYLESERLVRNGPTGIALGYEGLAAASGNGWPDLFEAQDLRLTPIRPGLVYGSYRYRVRYGNREAAGLSERLFLETDEGWRIALTTAFPLHPGHHRHHGRWWAPP